MAARVNSGFCLGICAENVGRDSARMLIENLDHGGCVDQYMQDQVRMDIVIGVFNSDANGLM